MVAITILYSFSFFLIFWGLYRCKAPTNTSQPKVSVILACRNEQEHILPLLEGLALQTYPQTQFEIIIADDASTDATVARACAFAQNHPQMEIKIISIQNRAQVVSAKKNALAQAIAVSRGELLLFTDADCRPLSGWMRGLVQHFSPETGMVIGFSPYELPALRGLGRRLMALESLSLAALAAGTCGWGRPATCTGRNLSYRRSLYDQVGGYRDIEKYVSGDDDLFLKLLLQRTTFRVRYALSAEAIAPTFFSDGWQHFVQQRLRHASKGLHYGACMTTVLFVAWLYNFLLFAALWTPIYKYGLILWAGKALAELPLLLAFSIKMKRWGYLIVWPIAAWLHVIYVVFFGALGPLVKFSWKEVKTAP